MSTGEEQPSPVGRTRGAGWQIGVSATIEVPTQRVWDFLVSTEGMAFWLGRGIEVLDGAGQRYETAEGTSGQVRSLRPHDRVRLTWHPKGWDNESTVQVALISPGPGRTMLRFHQERLIDADQRARQREHWRAVLAAVVAELQPHASTNPDGSGTGADT